MLPAVQGLFGLTSTIQQLCTAISVGSSIITSGRTLEYFAGEWRKTQSGLGGMVDGLSRWLDGGMSTPGHWMPEPDIPRITTRKDNRVNRLKCLGNAVVPQQFYPVFKAIADIERGFVHG